MKIHLIMTCTLFSLFVLMTTHAVGSCVKCEKVNVTEGGNATLHYATFRMTNIYEINCTTGSKTKIAQYCDPNDKCTTSSIAPDVSIEHGYLIVHGVTSNKCYRAEPESGEKQCYDVTAIKPLHSTISPEISKSQLSTATPFCNSTSDTHVDGGVVAGGVVAAAAVGAVVVGVCCYRRKLQKCFDKWRSSQVNAGKIPHEESFRVKYSCATQTLSSPDSSIAVRIGLTGGFAGNMEAANSLLTTVNKTQL